MQLLSSPYGTVAFIFVFHISVVAGRALGAGDITIRQAHRKVRLYIMPVCYLNIIRIICGKVTDTDLISICSRDAR